MSLIHEALKKTVESKQAATGEVLSVGVRRAPASAVWIAAIFFFVLVLGAGFWFVWHHNLNRLALNSENTATGVQMLETRLQLNTSELEKKISQLSAQIRDLKKERENLIKENRAFKNEIELEMAYQLKSFKTLSKNQEALNERFERFKNSSNERV